MTKTFNCGLGAVLVVAKQHESAVLEQLNVLGEKAVTVGKVTLHTEGLAVSYA